MTTEKRFTRTYRMTKKAIQQLQDLNNYLVSQGFRSNRSNAIMSAVDLAHELVIRNGGNMGDWRIISKGEHRALLRDRMILNVNLLSNGETIRDAIKRTNEHIEESANSGKGHEVELNRMCEDGLSRADPSEFYQNRSH